MSAEQGFSKAELQHLLDNLHTFPPKEQQELLAIVEELEARKQAEKSRTNLLDFAQAMMPDYKVGPHHRQLASLLEDMAHGRKSRVTVSIAPRFGKSQLTSIFFPAWFIGNWPDKKIMIVSHTADLAVDFGRKVRNLISSEDYAQIFPGVSLAADSKSAGRWNTNKGGEFFAVGIGGAIAGRGAHLLVVDDPHNEQEVLNGNFEIFDKAYEWYAYGARTRLMPGGSVAIVATRWAEQDLIGQVQKDMIRNPDADQWDVVEFPALLPKKGADPEAPETERYVSLWPEQWSVDALLKSKASMPPFQWAAQYMQQPTSREAAIIKRSWWQEWTKDEPPQCEYIIMSLDAAAEKNNRADYTALTTWGVFYKEDEHGVPSANIILLNAIKERMEFPELKRLAYRQYQEWSPDFFIVEKKSAGTQLYQEMRRGGVPVQEITPTRATGDKVVRLNTVSDIFASGLVWYPVGRRWAEEVVDEVCAFPAAAHDDLCFPATENVVMYDFSEKPIAQVRAGDFVHTPTGPCRVAYCAMSNPMAEVFTVTLSDGTTLTGTGAHPVYLPEKQAFVRLDALKPGDQLCIFLQSEKQRLLNIKGFVTGATPTALALRSAGTSLVTAVANILRSTASYGKKHMVRFLTGMTSTIKTATRAITGSKIWIACHAPTIGTSTAFQTQPPSSFTNANGVGAIEHLARKPNPPRKTASSAEQPTRRFSLSGLNFALQRANNYHIKLVSSLGRALFAARNSLQKTLRVPYAPSSAKLSATVPERQSVIKVGTLLERKSIVSSAYNAERSSWQATVAPAYVPKRANSNANCTVSVLDVAVCDQRKPVYAMQVEGNPVFYASNVLVHNCDSTVYALFRFRDGGFIRLPSDTWDNEDSDFKPVRANYY